MNLFDLSKFEKTAEDKHSTTMRHSDGHEIRIIHSSLPKLKQEQLKRLKLAKGGDILESGEGGESAQGKAVRWAKKDKHNSEAHMKGAKEEAKGRAEHEKEFVKPNIKGLAEGGPVKMYADSEETVSKDDSAPTTDQAQPSSQAPVVNVYAGAPNSAPAQAAPVQIPNPAQSMSQPPPAQNVPVPQNMVQSPIEQNGQLNPGKQAEMVQQAGELQKNIDVAKGKQLSDVQAGMNAANVTQAQNLNNNLNMLANQTKSIADYTLSDKNQININHYLENRSIPQKIANAFGLLAGGIKQGLIGGDNPALTFMNNQIQRDIEAQKNRQDQTKTVYGYYKDLYGAGNVTNNLTQAAMNNIYDGKVKKIAYDMGTPQAIQAYQAFTAQKGAENQKLLQDSATQLNALPGYNGTKSGNPQNPQPSPQGAPVQGSMDQIRGGFNKGAQEKEGASNENHILAPNHESHLKGLMYTPKAKEMMPAIQAQYNQAVQAEKGLNDIHGTFKNLSEAAEKTGEAGNFRRNFEHAASSIPIVGNAAAGLGRYVTDTENNRAYDANKVSLLGYVSSALKGTNIGSGQIQEIVDVNSPEYGDSPALTAKKEKNIREFIKNHTDTSLLDTWGLSLRKEK